jgi:hypothetical protein
MENDFARLAEAAIRLELEVANLYAVFHELFHEDEEIWWTLALEEKHHAAILRSGIKYFAPLGKFPDELMNTPLDEITEIISKVAGLSREFEKNPPTRAHAFRVALEIEMNGAELHYQQFMEKRGCSKMEKIFQELNDCDKDHIDRLISYMNDNEIPLEEA